MPTISNQLLMPTPTATRRLINQHLTARKKHAQLRCGEVPPFVESVHGHRVSVVCALHTKPDLHFDRWLRVRTHLQRVIVVYVLHEIDALS